MRTFGSPYPFHEVPWPDILAASQERASRHAEFGYVVDIAQSVIDTSVEQFLAGSMGMTDLHVVPRPVPDPPYEEIVVYAPNSVRPPPRGMVRIEHRALTNRNDKMDRPADEAVKLFWRFVLEKYGIEGLPPSPGQRYPKRAIDHRTPSARDERFGDVQRVRET